MARTLQPDSRIAHYQIVGPLGAGGMGEVYLARDEKLERNLALKILPPELMRSEDRVRRFMLEARSASSLNHPNIVTIYEVGHAAVLEGGEPSGGETVHYIAMELVGGKTLTELIHAERTELRTLLGYMAQAAEGLAKAHGAGIVHRDLKPGNVMVTADGFAKVLDFGLAKLTERAGSGPDATSAPTATGDLTAGGAVVGTVGYMSPEQIRGKGVDHRADVFAFGCMLYEAATRQKPFAAESHIDTLHRILHDQPRPIDEIDPSVPAELRRLIRRCLAKNPDQRVQSIKDLAIELREIVEEYDSLSASATSGSVVRPAPGAGRRRGVPLAAVAVVAVLGLAGIAFGLYSLLADRGGPASTRRFDSVRISSIMGHPDVAAATLSRDGRYLGYITQTNGLWSLRVRQVATGSDVEVVTPRQEDIRGVGFSPDGDYIFFLQRDPETPAYSALFQVASLGGTPRKRVFDVDSPVGFSPDGLRVAFLRGVPQEDRSELRVASLDSGDDRLVASIVEPENPLTDVGPAWSPDGRRIVVAVQDNRGGIRTTLTAFDPDDGKRETIASRPMVGVNAVAWLADGSGLVAVANFADAIELRPYHVAWPSGATRAITTDLDTYRGISVADDGSVASLRLSPSGDLWVASIDGAEGPRQITHSGSGSMGNVTPTEDGALVLTETVDERRRLIALGPDGADRRTIVTGAGHAVDPFVIRGADALVFGRVDEGSVEPHVFRIDLDGGNLRQLTTGGGENVLGASRDGSTVYFRRTELPNEVWQLPVTGGEPSLFLENSPVAPLFSPDGRFVLSASLREIDGRIRRFGMVLPVGGGEPVFEKQIPPRASQPGWHPSSNGVLLVDATDQAQNLWMFPLDGSDPAPITRFEEGRIAGYVWTDDGKNLVVCRILDQVSNLWVLEAATGAARPITDFRSGFLNQFAFLADQRRVVFVQGEIRRDVVLMRDAGETTGS